MVHNISTYILIDQISDIHHEILAQALAKLENKNSVGPFFILNPSIYIKSYPIKTHLYIMSMFISGYYIN